jgi:hypothetical protein
MPQVPVLLVKIHFLETLLGKHVQNVESLSIANNIPIQINHANTDIHRQSADIHQIPQILQKHHGSTHPVLLHLPLLNVRAHLYVAAQDLFVEIVQVLLVEDGQVLLAENAHNLLAENA